MKSLTFICSQNRRGDAQSQGSEALRVSPIYKRSRVARPNQSLVGSSSPGRGLKSFVPSPYSLPARSLVERLRVKFDRFIQSVDRFIEHHYWKICVAGVMYFVIRIFI